MRKGGQRMKSFINILFFICISALLFYSCGSTADIKEDTQAEEKVTPAAEKPAEKEETKLEKALQEEK